MSKKYILKKKYKKDNRTFEILEEYWHVTHIFCFNYDGIIGLGEVDEEDTAHHYIRWNGKETDLFSSQFNSNNQLHILLKEFLKEFFDIDLKLK